MDVFAELAMRAAGVASAALGWRPQEFWGATPAELIACLGGAAEGGADGLAADEVAALQERFPDG